MNYLINHVSFTVKRGTNGHAAEKIITSEQAAAVARAAIPDDAKEHFGVILLNSKNFVVAYHEVSCGSLDGTRVHAREVFAPALRVLGVSSIVLVHNHPSGDPLPSLTDRKLTARLRRCGRLLDVPIHDHVIIGNGSDRFYSFAKAGEFWGKKT
jgi:DNA repair protein RadC